MQGLDNSSSLMNKHQAGISVSYWYLDLENKPVQRKVHIRPFAIRIRRQPIPFLT